MKKMVASTVEKMQIRSFFRENMLLEVYDHESGVYYKSLIQEVNAANLAIGIPMKEGKQLLLQEKDSYFFRVFLEDALYSFQSEVQGRKKSGQVFLYLLSWPSKIERSQRRRFYRFAYTFDAHYWVLGQEKEFSGGEMSLLKQVESREPRQAVVTNLSGGGLAFVTEHSLSPGILLVLCFYLQNNLKVENKVLVKGRVVRAVPFKLGKERYYRYGVEFFDMSERTRDKIIRFIFSMFRQRLC